MTTRIEMLIFGGQKCAVECTFLNLSRGQTEYVNVKHENLTSFFLLENGGERGLSSSKKKFYIFYIWS